MRSVIEKPQSTGITVSKPISPKATVINSFTFGQGHTADILRSTEFYREKMEVSSIIPSTDQSKSGITL